MPLFYCIHCGQYIEADDEISGMEGNCPRCEGLITVPGTRRQLPQVVIKKLEPPTGSVPVFSADPAPAFAVYEPVPETPAERESAATLSSQGRRVVIKELPSGLAAMIPELTEPETPAITAPTERLESSPSDPSAPTVAEAKAEPTIPAASAEQASPTPRATISLVSPPAAAEAKPGSDPPAQPPKPSASSAPAGTVSSVSLEAVPVLDKKDSTDPKDSPEPASTSSPAKSGNESFSTTATEDPETVAPSDSSPKAETPPKSVPSWKPRPYVEPESAAKNLEATPKRKAPYLPTSALGMAWLLGGALWQVGLMLAAGPDSLIREKCRDSVMFLFATFVASLVMVGAAALVFSFVSVRILRLMKRKPFLGPVFCTTVMLLGLLLLAAGLVWYQHGCPWLK